MNPINGTGRLNPPTRGTAPLNPALVGLPESPLAAPAAAPGGDALSVTGGAVKTSAQVKAALAPYANASEAEINEFFRTQAAEDDRIQQSSVVGARATRTGVDANQQIVDAYVSIDTQMQAFLGDPPVANWTTFGKYAGRAAGQSISDLEKALNILDGLEVNDLGDLVDVFGKLPELMPVAMPLLREAYKKATGDDLPKDITDLGGLLDLGKNFVGGLIGGLFGKKNPIGDVAAELTKSVQCLRDNLVKANVAINNSFQPAFEAFVTAENSGLDGVAAVKKLVDDGTLKDPDGLIVDAMRCYQQAGALNKQSAQASPEARTALLAEREALIKRANLLVGLHEQYHVASAAFEDPQFSHLVEMVTPSLSVRDANGVNGLLPNGGNWADFATRMGVTEVPAAEAEAAFKANADMDGELFALTDPETGKKRYFRPAAEASKREGTIYDFFTRGATGKRAEANMAGAPPAIGSDTIVRQLSYLLERCDAGSAEDCAKMAETVRGKHPEVAEVLDELGSPGVRAEFREAVLKALGDGRCTDSELKAIRAEAKTSQELAAAQAATA